MKFAVTFGSQYRNEPHPNWEAAHPRGYVIVEAPDETEARFMVFERFKSAWSFIYWMGGPDWKNSEHLYSRGALGLLTKDGLSTYGEVHRRSKEDDVNEDEHHDAYMQAIDDAVDPNPPEPPMDDLAQALFNLNQRARQQVEAMMCDVPHAFDLAKVMYGGLMDWLRLWEPKVADALAYGVEEKPHGFTDLIRIKYPLDETGSPL